MFSYYSASTGYIDANASCNVFFYYRMGSLAVECVLFLENECHKESESVIAIVVVQVLQGLLCSQSQE